MPVAAETSRAGGAGARTRPNRGLTATLAAIGPLFAGYALPFLLVIYLGLKGGGYDLVIRSEVGIAVWWVVLLRRRRRRCSRAPASARAALGRPRPAAAPSRSGPRSASRGRSPASAASPSSDAWPPTSGSSRWRSSSQGREGLRRTVSARRPRRPPFVGILALLSRLHPSWFPANETAEARALHREPPQLPARTTGTGSRPWRRSACRCCLAWRRPPRTIAAQAAGGRRRPGRRAGRLLHPLARRRPRDRGRPGRAPGPLPPPARRCSPAWRSPAAGGAS